MQHPLRPTRLVKPQGLTSIAANTPSPSTGFRIDWPTDCFVLWMLGGLTAVATNDALIAGMTALGFRIQRKGTSEIVTDGQAAAYVQFQSAFPSAGFRFPLYFDVKQNDTWFVFIRNMSTGTPFTPDLAFAIDERHR